MKNFLKTFFKILKIFSFVYVAFHTFLYILAKSGQVLLASKILNFLPDFLITFFDKCNFVFFAVVIFSVFLVFCKLFKKVYAYYLVILVLAAIIIIFNNWIYPIPGIDWLLSRFPQIGNIVGLQYAFLCLFGSLFRSDDD